MTNVQRKKKRTPHQPTGCWIRPEKRYAIYLRDDFVCLLCGHVCPAALRTLDHVTPRSRGGSNHESNLFLACRSCNSERQSDKIPSEVRAEVRRHARRKLDFYLNVSRRLFRTGRLSLVILEEQDGAPKET